MSTSPRGLGGLNDLLKVLKATPALFTGTIVDVLEIRDVKTANGRKNKIQIVWVLGSADGTHVLSSKGAPIRATRWANATMDPNSALYVIVQGILGHAPSTPFDFETLIGRSNLLSISKGTSRGRIYEVRILPLGDLVVPVIPQGFVRAKECRAINLAWRRNACGSVHAGHGKSLRRNQRTPCVSLGNKPPSQDLAT